MMQINKHSWIAAGFGKDECAKCHCTKVHVSSNRIGDVFCNYYSATGRHLSGRPNCKSIINSDKI